MTDKKIISVRMTAKTAKRLRIMAAVEGLPQGEMIEALLQLKNFEKYLNKEGQELFNKVWDSCKFNAVNKKSGWKDSEKEDSVTVFFE